jgi:thioredoxin reductase (NADPH)
VAAAVRRLTVLSRTYCHLCDDLVTALEDFRGRSLLRVDSLPAFEIDVVDIDQHPALEEMWGDKVPVLMEGEKEICHYFFDEAVTMAHFRATLV